MYLNLQLCQQDLLVNSVISSILEENNAIRLGIMDSLIRRAIKYGVSQVFPSRYLIGKENNICSKTVDRYLEKSRELGWVSTSQRFNNTNVYHLDPSIFSEFRVLAKLLPSLNIFFLVSATGLSFRDGVHLNNKDIYTTPERIHLIVRKTTGKRSKAQFWDPSGSSRNKTSQDMYVLSNNYPKKKEKVTITNEESGNGEQCSCKAVSGCIWAI